MAAQAEIRHLRDVTQGRRPSRLRLLAPLRYLTISNPEKNRYDFIYPGAFGFVVWGCYWLFTPDVPLFGEHGLLGFARDLLIMAVPFLFGALAVVATGYPGAHFDERLRGVNLILDGRPLTLRRFIAYLLGYLSFLGLVTLAAVVAADLLHSDVERWTAGWSHVQTALQMGGSLILTLLCSALTVTVFWSLYFLTDVVNHAE